MKTRYIVSAHVWDAKRESHDPVDISRHKTFDDAVIAYNALKPDKNMAQVELWEEVINRFGVVEDIKRVKRKDTACEDEEAGFGEWYCEYCD